MRLEVAHRIVQFSKLSIIAAFFDPCTIPSAALT